MGFRYDLTALELLDRLDGTSSPGREALARAEREHGLTLPSVWSAFLEAAADSPLLSTADVWTDKAGELRFLYDEIQEMIDESSPYWEERPEDYADNEYFQLAQLSREQWGSRVPDFLLIGSDCGAGVVQFGIRREDLGQEDPPVYVNHECDCIWDWRLWDKSVSAFLMRTLCDVLCCGEYQTAKRVLEKKGWTARRLCREDLPGLGLDLSAMLRWPSTYGEDAIGGCGYDEAEGRLAAVRVDRGDARFFQGMEYRRPI